MLFQFQGFILPSNLLKISVQALKSNIHLYTCL